MVEMMGNYLRFFLKTSVIIQTVWMFCLIGGNALIGLYFARLLQTHGSISDSYMK